MYTLADLIRELNNISYRDKSLIFNRGGGACPGRAMYIPNDRELHIHWTHIGFIPTVQQYIDSIKRQNNEDNIPVILNNGQLRILRIVEDNDVAMIYAEMTQ